MQENLCERKNKLPIMQLWKHGMCLDKQGVAPPRNKTKNEPEKRIRLRGGDNRLALQRSVAGRAK